MRLGYGNMKLEEGGQSVRCIQSGLAAGTLGLARGGLNPADLNAVTGDCTVTGRMSPRA